MEDSRVHQVVYDHLSGTIFNSYYWRRWYNSYRQPPKKSTTSCTLMIDLSLMYPYDLFEFYLPIICGSFLQISILFSIPCFSIIQKFLLFLLIRNIWLLLPRKLCVCYVLGKKCRLLIGCHWIIQRIKEGIKREYLCYVMLCSMFFVHFFNTFKLLLL